MYNLVDPWESSSNLETANEWKGKEKGTFFDNLASYWSAFFALICHLSEKEILYHFP